MFGIFMDLLKRGVDFKHKGFGGMSLLHCAVAYDNLEVVEELLKLGLAVDDVDDSGNNAMHFIKSVEVFRVLVIFNKKPDLLSVKNSAGKTPLFNVVTLFGGEPVPLELILELIKNGSDVNASDNEGFRPIHAVSTEEWINFLIKHGADVNAANNQGENAVHLALKNQKWKLARFLLHKTEIDRFAVTNDDVSYIGYFTTGRANYGEVFDGELREVFEQLVDKHINSKTFHGGLLINSFVHSSVLKQIKHPKADLHKAEADGQTSLHRAILFKSSFEVVKTLVESGLDINAADEKGFTALMYSIDYNCTDVAKFLIAQSNINLNLTNAYGFTALHYAARSENIEVLCRLLAAGADPKIHSNVNLTFFDLLRDDDKKLFAAYSSTL